MGIRYKPLLSIDTKNVPAALHFTSKQCFYDVGIREIEFTMFADYFKLSLINPVKCNFDMLFHYEYYMKGNDYDNIYNKWQVHIRYGNIFELLTKHKYRQVATIYSRSFTPNLTPTLHYGSVKYFLFFSY